MQLVLYPALVQGVGAAASIAKGIRLLDQLNLDTIIIGRGGGSIEDLWAFNEELVAREIYRCKTPIISAVGHETDVTIADFVADLRAPTPSAAAELAVNDYMAYLSSLRDYKRQLYQAMKQKLTYQQARLEKYKLQLEYASPAYQIKQMRQELMDKEQKLQHLMEQRIRDYRHRMDVYISKLEGLSPLSKLSKGYALVVGEDNKPVQTIKKIKKDEQLTISLFDGDVITRVKETREIKRSKMEGDKNG